MKRPGGRRVILIGLVVGLATSGGLAYVWLSSAGGPPPPVPDPAEGQHGPMIALDERVVNLQPGGPFRYAKIGVTVELRPADPTFYTLTGEARAAADELAIKEYVGVVPLLLDTLGTVVSARTSTDLVTVDGRGALKRDLIEAIRSVVGEREVLDVYFTDLVMQ
jgi:flagellar basal body-associated protein FliL